MKYILRYISAVLLLLMSTDLLACLNLYVIDERGKEGLYSHGPVYQIRIVPQEDLDNLRGWEKHIREEGKKDHRYISNYAVYLIKLGRNKEALPILKNLAKQKPGEYEVLANLAVAYELNGYPDSALKYMKQSVKINPYAHNGSEWWHVQFLEAVILHRDKKTSIDAITIFKPDTLYKDKTGMDFGEQLQERIPLTSAPNAMLSKALEESGDYFKSYVSIDWSAKLYAMAIGFSTNETTTNRLWQKLERARARVVEISKKNNRAARKDVVRNQLLVANWKSILQKDIDKWKAHRAHYEKNLTILNL